MPQSPQPLLMTFTRKAIGHSLAKTIGKMMDNDAAGICADACWECAAICETASSACYGHQDMGAVANAMWECATVARCCGSLCLSNSEALPQIKAATVQYCQATIKMCKPHESTVCCGVAIEACMRCIEACAVK